MIASFCKLAAMNLTMEAFCRAPEDLSNLQVEEVLQTAS
jgi:hypothetical protein